MDSYIVRIYQRLQEGQESLVGVIELVEQQEEKTFKTVAELMEILSSITMDRTYLYVSDAGDNSIRKIVISAKTVTTL